MILPSFGIATEPLSADKLFSIGSVVVTNTILFGLVTALFTVGLLLLAARSSKLHPMSRLAFYTELLVDAILSSATDIFGDKQEALRQLPLLGTLFTFILVCNLSGSGLIPGVGTLSAHAASGQTVSLLRPFTTDLNATLAMAILCVGLAQYYGLRKLGLRGHFRHYFKKPMWNPMNLFIGLNEVFGEFLRIITLAMRLFGVIYAGEVLIAAVGQLAGNFGWIATVPTVLLEIFFSIVQAYVFMMLTATYLAIDESDESHSGGSQEAAKAGATK